MAHHQAGQDEATPEEVRSTSDRLLRAVDDLRRLEAEKRRLEISSPQFHDLATEVAHRSRRVFDIAAEEDEIGDRIRERQGISIEDAGRPRG